MMITTLIADDEPHALAYLSRLVEAHPDLQLLGSLKNGREVVSYCQHLSPGLLLLDIEMPGLDGLEVARKVLKRHPESQVVFITAYDQYAIDAFEVEAVGYLLKPFDESSFRKVIKRASDQVQLQQKVQFGARVERLWHRLRTDQASHLEKIEIKQKGLVENVLVKDIIMIRADSECVRILTKNQTFIERISLRLLSEQLPPFFHRVHRSVIINSHLIQSWKYLQNGTFRFELSDGQEVRSSRSYLSDIREWLGALDK